MIGDGGEVIPFERQPVLEGDSIRLRGLRMTDFEPLYAIASDPLLWAQHPSKDRTEQAVFRRWFDDAIDSGGALAVVDRSNQAIIGSSRFDHLDASRSEIEIGWTFLARSHWGGTINSEMKKLMLHHAFRFVESVVFRVHSRNLRSQRAVEKLGATRVGTEVDDAGRGENIVFRLRRSSYA